MCSFRREMVCDYLKICRGLKLLNRHSVECDVITVMRWACTGYNHNLYLCDEHVKKLHYSCPFHHNARLAGKCFDGTVPE